MKEKSQHSADIRAGRHVKFIFPWKWKLQCLLPLKQPQEGGLDQTVTHLAV